MASRLAMIETRHSNHACQLRPTMTEIALFEAKRRLTELVDRVQRGEVFALTRRGKVVAQPAAAMRTTWEWQVHAGDLQR